MTYVTPNFLRPTAVSVFLLSFDNIVGANRFCEEISQICANPRVFPPRLDRLMNSMLSRTFEPYARRNWLSSEPDRLLQRRPRFSGQRRYKPPRSALMSLFVFRMKQTCPQEFAGFLTSSPGFGRIDGLELKHVPHSLVQIECYTDPRGIQFSI